MRWAKAETCFEEIRDRSYKIWHFDVDDMLKQASHEYQAQLSSGNGKAVTIGNGHTNGTNGVSNGSQRGYTL